MQVQKGPGDQFLAVGDGTGQLGVIRGEVLGPSAVQPALLGQLGPMEDISSADAVDAERAAEQTDEDAGLRRREGGVGLLQLPLTLDLIVEAFAQGLLRSSIGDFAQIVRDALDSFISTCSRRERGGREGRYHSEEEKRVDEQRRAKPGFAGFEVVAEHGLVDQMPDGILPREIEGQQVAGGFIVHEARPSLDLTGLDGGLGA